MNTTDHPLPDLSDHDTFTNGPPLEAFKWLRENDPVHWTAFKGGKGYWSLTRYKDIIDANANFKVFSSAQGIRMEDQTREEYLARRTFQETDPPEHTRFRRLVSGALSKPSVARFEESITAISRQIIERALDEREFDAVSAIARPLPMRMLGRILGTPESDSDWLVKKGDELIANSDPDYTDKVVDSLDSDQYKMMPFRSPAGLELFDYAQKQLEEQRKSGNTDGILHIVTAPDENGDRISDTEFRNFFCLLVAAGNDTTRYSIASSLYRLATQPGLAEQLRQGDDDLWRSAPDELIRVASPAMHFRRTAVCDHTVHGKTIKTGDKVVYWFVSGNRDENVFPDPEIVQPDRRPNRHMAFGLGGPHICLGMWLAKLEMTIVMREFLQRVQSVEQTAPHKYLRSNFVNGIKSLPLRVKPI
ncbi:MAG: cytochrome P450 [Gammaproteobacteria bacterium]|nr:cytochrome P450 [Gammaproteobacteria bacterium]